MKLKSLIATITVIPAILLGGCSDCLSDDELEVINENLADIVYKGNIDRRSEAVGKYLNDAVKFYSDEVHNQTQNKIDDRNATAALWGDAFDIGELYGTSTNQLIANKYYSYIDYINDHLEDAEDDLETITKIIKANPDIIDTFYDGRSTISLSNFSSVEGLPSSISQTQFEKYKNLDFDKNTRSRWGELLMGNVQSPHYSPLTLLCALVIRIERLKYPTPVYAVYKEYDDEEGWEVGYDTSQAYFVTFNQDGDILEFDYKPVDYFEGYIDSDNNILTKDK